MLLLASFPFVTFYLHDLGRRTLEATWRDFVSSAAFREAILEAVELVRRYQIESWIADDRQLGPMLPEDLAWVATDIFPALAAQGLRRLALVEPEDWLNRELIEEAYTPPLDNLAIDVRRFTDLASARAWARGL